MCLYNYYPDQHKGLMKESQVDDYELSISLPDNIKDLMVERFKKEFPESHNGLTNNDK